MTRLAAEKKRLDVVIMDPPRSGSSEEFIKSLVRMKPKQVLYISCNPQTQIRDLQMFERMGYRVQGKLVPVDMFPHTVHVETVCLLSREKEVKRYVHVDITPEELGMQEGGKTVKHPTYKQIKEYVKATHGLNVSPLYIATVKEECGLEKQFSYKEAGMEAGRRPNCPPEKREAIIDAFVHFGMMGK